MRLKLSDMSPALRERVEAALAKQAAAGNGQPETSVRIAQDAPDEPGGTKTRTQPEERKGEARMRLARAPNKTESEYNRLYLSGKGLYEAITLRLPGGSRYTPDWVVIGEGAVELHEVKGSYRFGSQGRALTAFREAVAAFPCFTFVWAKREKDGRWEIKRYGGPQNA